LETSNPPSVTVITTAVPTLNEALSLNADGVYPEAYFRQRIEEEAHRAHRTHSLLTLVLVQGDTPVLAHALRGGIRRMDVLGLWKKYLGVLLSEVPREEVSPAFADRLSQQAQGVMRIAGVVDTEWQEIYLGACILPDQKSGKVDASHLLASAEKALVESSNDHQPILYKGNRRFVDVPRKEAPASLVRYGDLHLGKDHHRGWIGPDTIDFLPKEYELLMYLLKHQGKLIRRDVLCRSVWGYDYFGNSRTVDMHIAKLRKKIKTSRAITIKTLKGEGYRLDVLS
jgi:hypothetical protein